MATSSLPLDVLDAMLRNESVTQEDNPDDRLKIARFYIQAERYDAAGRELEAIRKNFPERLLSYALITTRMKLLMRLWWVIVRLKASSFPDLSTIHSASSRVTTGPAGGRRP